ncbi:MAG: 3-keto-5-aminohexanoate cleavage protein [Frankia sp.]
MTSVQACLNGSRRPVDHPALPVSAAALAADAAGCQGAGAASVHVHPHSPGGWPSLAAPDVLATVAAIRSRCPSLPVGVTTLAAVEPDPAKRTRLVARWGGAGRPDFASVNFDEPGAFEVARTLIDLDVGVEAGVRDPHDARRLLESGLADACVRVLLEPLEPGTAAALATAAQARRVLLDGGCGTPFLLHGNEGTAWPVLTEALRLGLDTRVGLEDTLLSPDGGPTPGNVALVSAATDLL